MSLQNEIKKTIKKFKTKKNKTSYDIKGSHNRIIIVNEDGTEYQLKEDETFENLNISIYGSNNVIRIFKPFICNGTNILIGNYPEIHNDGANIELQSSSNFSFNNIIICYGKNQVLKVGAGTTMYNCIITLPEDSKVTIGEDCMFAGLSNIRGGDGHSVYNCDTGEILNKENPGVVIGNHCWIGSGVSILKKAKIPDCSVVAERSVVTKAFERPKQGGLILAGVPARVKKEGINWSRLSPSHFRETKQNPLEVERV